MIASNDSQFIKSRRNISSKLNVEIRTSCKANSLIIFIGFDIEWIDGILSCLIKSGCHCDVGNFAWNWSQRIKFIRLLPTQSFSNSLVNDVLDFNLRWKKRSICNNFYSTTLEYKILGNFQRNQNYLIQAFKVDFYSSWINKTKFIEYV